MRLEMYLTIALIECHETYMLIHLLTLLLLLDLLAEVNHDAEQAIQCWAPLLATIDIL